MVIRAVLIIALKASAMFSGSMPSNIRESRESSIVVMIPFKVLIASVVLSIA